jgi:hypothetical protein
VGTRIIAFIVFVRLRLTLLWAWAWLVSAFISIIIALVDYAIASESAPSTMGVSHMNRSHVIRLHGHVYMSNLCLFCMMLICSSIDPNQSAIITKGNK